MVDNVYPAVHMYSFLPEMLFVARTDLLACSGYGILDVYMHKKCSIIVLLVLILLLISKSQSVFIGHILRVTGYMK